MVRTSMVEKNRKDHKNGRDLRIGYGRLDRDFMGGYTDLHINLISENLIAASCFKTII